MELAAAVLAGEGHAPLWQYFAWAEAEKADESIPAPKGADRGTSDSSSLQISRFLEVRNGATMMLFPGPPPPATRRRSR